MEKILQATFLICLIAWTAYPGHAQFQPTPVQRSTNQVELNGRMFYMHEVKKGHTLYSISHAYEISRDSIIAYNPVLKGQPLKPGMVLRIPVVEPVVQQPVKDTNYLYHCILKRETWFSLSRFYGIRVSDLRRANPGYRWGLPTGDTLKIPKQLITHTELIPQTTPDEKTVPPDSTNPEGVTKLHNSLRKPVFNNIFIDKPSLEIALILPLYLSINDTLTINDTIQPDLRFWDFLQGSYLAVDSLRKAGFSIKLHIFDSERAPGDTHTIRGIIDSGRLDHMDLIIGPVYNNTLTEVVQFAERKQIPVVSPLSSKNDAVTAHPYLFQVNLSKNGQKQIIAQFIGRKQEEHLVILAPYAKKFSRSFRKYMDEIQAARNQNGFIEQIPTLFYDPYSKSFIDIDSLPASLYTTLRVNQANLVIIPSDDEVFVTEMINRLKVLPEGYSMTILGEPEWSRFRTIDLQYLFDLEVAYWSNFSNPFVDYERQEVSDFCRKYHLNWNTEPSRFSFQGYDILFFFISHLRSGKFYRNDQKSDDVRSYNYLQTPMYFISPDRGSGFQNEALPLIRYNRELLTRSCIQVIHTYPGWL